MFFMFRKKKHFCANCDWRSAWPVCGPKALHGTGVGGRPWFRSRPSGENQSFVRWKKIIISKQFDANPPLFRGKTTKCTDVDTSTGLSESLLAGIRAHHFGILWYNFDKTLIFTRPCFYICCCFADGGDLWRACIVWHQLVTGDLEYVSTFLLSHLISKYGLKPRLINRE